MNFETLANIHLTLLQEPFSCENGTPVHAIFHYKLFVQNNYSNLRSLIS